MGSAIFSIFQSGQCNEDDKDKFFEEVDTACDDAFSMADGLQAENLLLIVHTLLINQTKGKRNLPFRDRAKLAEPAANKAIMDTR